MPKRDFLAIPDFSRAELLQLFEVVARLKMDGQAGPLGPGDVEVKTPAPVRVGTRDLVLVLDRAP